MSKRGRGRRGGWNWGKRDGERRRCDRGHSLKRRRGIDGPVYPRQPRLTKGKDRFPEDSAVRDNLLVRSRVPEPPTLKLHWIADE